MQLALTELTKVEFAGFAQSPMLVSVLLLLVIILLISPNMGAVLEPAR